MKILYKIINFIKRIPILGKLLIILGTKLLYLAWKIPYVRMLINRLATNFLASSTTPRPRPYSLWSPDPNPGEGITDYTSWPALTNKRFSGRHLPPAEPAYTNSLPNDIPYDRNAKKSGAITVLFERKGSMITDRSSLLFMFFAQWFTDSVLRIDPSDRRKNTSNHDIDLCQIYGLTEETGRLLRTMKDGKLKSQMINNEEYLDYLCESDGRGGWKVKECYKKLYSRDIDIDLDKFLDKILEGFDKSRREKLYATGLERGNSSVGYVAISTLFMREHNRICDQLKLENPTWDDERLFQTARMINTVILLKLVIEDYINHISGRKLFYLDVGFAEKQNWYRINWITLEFDLLYRWHGLVPDEIKVNEKNYQAEEYRNNNALFEQAGLTSIITSASKQPAGRIGLFNTPDFLWEAEYFSIKMSRDYRLHSYNDYREQFSLNRFNSFNDLTKDKELQATLRKLYGDIEKVEFLVGLFAEDRDNNSLFGELLNRMVAYDALTQIYTNPLLSKNIFNEKTFTAYGLKLISETNSVRDLAKRNISSDQELIVSFSI
ncbi:peroxidase family protein [Nitrosomonas sp. Nm166]|uniref:peroxidase family protein n=1 Tax=Nitrosomonas sp. Nm166 TaxID=1881054 RepID=UPI0008E8E222|nr:peroxidase family protein [Nitrosomonas sp. Nm166]SFE21270.1 prostaglandin-endoperoxide synthase 2 [Nitrosomonas sp. Nm166]